MAVKLDLQYLEKNFIEESQKINDKASGLIKDVFEDSSIDNEVKGWVHETIPEKELSAVVKKAAEIRGEAGVFLLVGVGGSNQAARALIEALREKITGPEIIFAGNTLSARSVKYILKKVENKNVFVNVIVKNFETLEPGSHYRIIRKIMRDKYSDEEQARRIVITGTNGSGLHKIANREGHLFLEFPEYVGGRFSAFSAVSLLPLAVAGLDIEKFLAGRLSMYHTLRKNYQDNIAVRYALLRNIFHNSGYSIEVMSVFEPDLNYLMKWWWQLYGESEGKDGMGLYPSMAVYSEDLHSIGQYMQDGKRVLIETFLSVTDPEASVPVNEDRSFGDGFDYLERIDFNEINKVAEKATITAHRNGGVPCMQIVMEKIDEFNLGEIMYFFMISCILSGKLLGINPFNQDGVEEYKKSMFSALGR